MNLKLITCTNLWSYKIHIMFNGRGESGKCNLPGLIGELGSVFILR